MVPVCLEAKGNFIPFYCISLQKTVTLKQIKSHTFISIL